MEQEQHDNVSADAKRGLANSISARVGLHVSNKNRLSSVHRPLKCSDYKCRVLWTLITSGNRYEAPAGVYRLLYG